MPYTGPPLSVCPRCGWHELSKFEHQGDCATLGRVADELATAMAALGYPSTKLGYGFGYVTIYTRERRPRPGREGEDMPPHVRFSVEPEGVRIASGTGGVWNLGRFTVPEAVEILSSLFASPFGRKYRHDGGS